MDYPVLFKANLDEPAYGYENYKRCLHPGVSLG